MFDIGFFELLVVGIVGLVVIGPERLPETVRTVTLWFGRFKQSISETRTELEKQIGADDIRRQLHNERIMKQLRDTRDDINRTIKDDLNPNAQPTAAASDSENQILPESATTAAQTPPASQETPVDEQTRQP